MNNEIWKDIVGYEGYYQVSNMGRVRSLDRIITDRRGYDYFLHGKILSPGMGTNGYLSIALAKEHVTVQRGVHVLVAKTFLDYNYRKYDKVINHKNGIKTDNRVDNLEIVTMQENVNHAIEHDLIKCGPDSKNSVLSIEDACKAYIMVTQFGAKQKQLGVYFDVSATTIRRYTRWIGAHLKDSKVAQILPKMKIKFVIDD